MGRDGQTSAAVAKTHAISTHTPAWGVTNRPQDRARRIPDFNSHARVGRDIRNHEKRLELRNFNSHARVGRDQVKNALKKILEISTHTPAWGVTIVLKFRAVQHANFNSHARVGRDKKK